MAGLAGLALAATLGVTGCSSASGGGDAAVPVRTGAAGGSSAPSTASTAAARWWSNAAADKGSAISVTDPTADAGKLHADRTQYCQMLKQTVAAGKSILPGVTATDPRLLASTEAFISELQHVAPAQVSGQWQVLGDALVSFVKTGGKSLGGVTTAKLTSLAAVVAADAKDVCHVDISGAGS